MTREKSKRAKRSRARAQSARSADYSDIRRALDRHGAEILKQIPLKKVQLSQPVDGAGARICVSVEPGEEQKVPQSIVIRIGGRNVSIRIEALGDYETVKAQKGDIQSS